MIPQWHRLAARTAVLMLAVYACRGSAQAGTAPGKESSIVVTDSRGRSVEVSLPVRRVVTLSSDAAEIIRALGAAERIVGVSSTTAKKKTFWPELSKVAVIGHAFRPNYEKVAQLRPDIVVAYGGMRPGPECEEKLSHFGITVLRLDCYRPATLAHDIRALGKILEREGAAEALVSTIEKYTSLVKTRLAGLPQHKWPRVYTEGYSDFRANGPGSGGHEMCVFAGGRNIAATLSVPYPTVSSEWVIEQNPQIILKAVSSSTGAGGYECRDPSIMAAIRRRIMQRTGWAQIDAVKSGRVYLVSADVWLGPASFVALLQVAKWFHPALFDDVDPRAVHREYLKRFHGLTRTGVQFYP